MDSKEIMAYCWSKQWQPSIGWHTKDGKRRRSSKPFSIDNPNIFPVWGETHEERLLSWQDIRAAYISGECQGMLPHDAVELRYGFVRRRVVSLGHSPRLDDKGKAYFVTRLQMRCLDCRARFVTETRLPFRSVPDQCPACQRKLNPQELIEAANVADKQSEHAGRPSAVRDAVEHFKALGGSVPLSEIVAYAKARMTRGESERDRRYYTIRRALRKMDGVQISKDAVHFV